MNKVFKGDGDSSKPMSYSDLIVSFMNSSK